MLPKFPRLTPRLTAATAAALCATLAGCSDHPPTAPASADAAPRLSQSGESKFDEESKLSLIEATTSMRPVAMAVAPWGAGGQAAVLSSNRGGFPLEGSRYLVVSSGGAESFERDSDGANSVAYNSPCDAADVRCDVGGVDLTLTLPSDAQMVEFDVRYYTWDFDGHLDPFRVYELAESGPPRQVFEATTLDGLTAGFGGELRYGATVRRVSLNVAGYPLQNGYKVLKLRFEASDSPSAGQPDRTLDSGALIDRLRVLTTSNRDGHVPVVRGTAASPDPVPYTQASTVTGVIDDAGTGGSPIASAEYSVDGGRYAPMLASEGAFGTSATQSVSGQLGPSSVNFYVRTVCVRGRDDAGNLSANACVDQVVYDPAQSYVLGSGWFESLPGAYGDGSGADYPIRGRTSFGFSTGYKPGAIAPTGDTRFTLKAAGLEFRSTSNEYLFVSGAEGRYKGRGAVTLNGAPLTEPGTGRKLTGEAFGLLVAATDGRAAGREDAVRIRIWRLSDQGVVYDNLRACGLNDAALVETASPGAYYDCTTVRGGQITVGSGTAGSGGGKRPRK